MADAEQPGSQKPTRPPVPTDHLTADGPFAPPDHLESPREESITRSDPYQRLEEDTEAFNEFRYPGETLDLFDQHVERLRTPQRPVPWYSVTAVVGLLVWGGMYLGAYSGGFHADVFSEYPNFKMSTEAPADPKDPKVMRIAGQKLFTVNCVQCHQSTGLGQAGQFPPLVASEWVVGDAPKRLVQILLHGIQGTIHVKDAVYNNNMPAWNTLTDKQIASILTYVRSEWGNSAGPISEEDMANARKLTSTRTEPWTEAELRKIPAGPLSEAAPAGGGAAAVPNLPVGKNPPDVTTGDIKPPSAPLGQGPAPNPVPAP